MREIFTAGPPPNYRREWKIEFEGTQSKRHVRHCPKTCTFDLVKVGGTYKVASSWVQ